jgi:hypothetical protein
MSEHPARDGSALAVACTAQTDLIKIAPPRRPLSAPLTGRRVEPIAPPMGGAPSVGLALLATPQA